jgi:UDP-N-acetylmuramyl tripeptide synthase
MGAVSAKLADQTVVTNDNPRSEAPAAIIGQIIAGIPADRVFQIEADRALAIQQSIFAAQDGDIVLIAGKGHESFQEVAGTRYPFSDRLCVKTALAHRRNTRVRPRLTQ